MLFDLVNYTASVILFLFSPIAYLAVSHRCWLANAEVHKAGSASEDEKGYILFGC